MLQHHVKMETLILSEADRHTKDQFRFVCTVSGGLCVMTTGVMLLLVWRADGMDIQLKVSIHKQDIVWV